MSTVLCNSHAIVEKADQVRNAAKVTPAGGQAKDVAPLGQAMDRASTDQITIEMFDGTTKKPISKEIKSLDGETTISVQNIDFNGSSLRM